MVVLKRKIEVGIEARPISNYTSTTKNEKTLQASISNHSYQQT